MSDELRKSNVRHEVVEILDSDSSTETDDFLTTHIPKTAYEKRLTQSEDVIEWIDDPLQISRIQPNLHHFASFVKALPQPWRMLDAGC